MKIKEYYWNGEGDTLNASNPANWEEGHVPHGHHVRIIIEGDYEVVWDIPTTSWVFDLSGFTGMFHLDEVLVVDGEYQMPDEVVSLISEGVVISATDRPPPDKWDIKKDEWRALTDRGIVREDRENRQWIWRGEVYCSYFGVGPNGELSFGTVYTFDDGGADGNWTNVNNWGGGGAPTTNSDKAVIPTGISRNINTNVAFTVGEVDMQLGNTATITFTGNCTIDNAGGLTGNWTTTAGTVTPGAYQLSVDGNVDLSGGTFNRGTSTLVLAGTSKTLTLQTGQYLKNLTISGSITLAGATYSTVDGVFTNTGTLTVGSVHFYFSGATAISGFDNSLGVITSGSGKIYFYNGTATVDNFGDLTGCTVRFQNSTATNYVMTLGASLSPLNLEIGANSTGTLEVNTGTNYSITTGNLTHYDSIVTLTANASTITASGNVDFSVGTFSRGTSTLVMSGTSKTFDVGGNSIYSMTCSGTITCLSHMLINGGTFTNTGTVTVNTTYQLTLFNGGIATFDNSLGTITGAGDLTFFLQSSNPDQTVNNFGTITITRIIFEGNNALTADKTITLGANLTASTSNLKIISDHASYTMTLDTSVTNYSVSVQDISLSGTTGGILTANASTVTASGNVDLSAGTFTQGTATLVMTGTKALTITSGIQRFHKFTINNSNTVTCAGGTLNAYASTWTIGVGSTLNLGTLSKFMIENASLSAWSNSGTLASNGVAMEFTLNGSVKTETIALGTCIGNGNLDIKSQSNTHSLTLAGNLDIGTGSFTTVPSTGNISFDAATYTVDCGDFTIGTSDTYDAGTNTITASGSVDLSAGTFTQGTSTLVMNGTSKTLTTGSSSSTFYNLTINGTTTLAGVQTTITSGTYDGNSTFTIGVNFFFSGTAAATNFDNSGGTITGAGTLIFFGGSGTVDNFGTLQVNINFNNNAGTKTYTLGEALTTTGNIDILLASGISTVVDTATYGLSVGGTTTISANTTLQTGANATGATWTLQNNVTVSGTMTCTNATGTMTILMTAGKSITCSGTMTLTGAASNVVLIDFQSTNAGNDMILDNGTITWDYVTVDFPDRLNVNSATLDIDGLTVTNALYGIAYSTGLPTITNFGTNVACSITASNRAWRHAIASNLIGSGIKNITLNGNEDVSIEAAGILELEDCTLTNVTCRMTSGGGFILDGDASGATNDNFHIWGTVSHSDHTNATTTSSVITIHDDDNGAINNATYTVDQAWSLLSCTIETNSTLSVNDNLIITPGTFGPISNLNFITGGTIVSGGNGINWGGAWIENTKLSGNHEWMGAYFGGGCIGQINRQTTSTVQNIGAMIG